MYSVLSLESKYDALIKVLDAIVRECLARNLFFSTNIEHEIDLADIAMSMPSFRCARAQSRVGVAWLCED
jgi:hypothetical protein